MGSNSKTYARQHYLANRQAYVERAAAHRKAARDRNRDLIRNVKTDTSCRDCGCTYPHYVMTFDHVRGQKLFNVAEAVHRGLPEARLEAEIAKCDIVCANCHAERTWARGQRFGPDAADECQAPLGACPAVNQ